MGYSFAKTPLKAAQAPLAAARGIHGTFVLTGLVGCDDGGMASGIRGSATDAIVGC